MLLNDNERIDKINDGLQLIQRKDGLTFGTDAFLLAAYINNTNGISVEFGSGTGIISLLLLNKNKTKHIYAYEVQESFSALTKRNAELNSFSDRISVINKDVREVKGTDIPKEADVLFTNPPYMKSGAGLCNITDEKNIARREIYGCIDDFLHSAKKLLKHGGRFYCVYRPDRLIDLLSTMRSNGIEPKRITFVHSDRDSAPSLVLIEGRCGAGVELKITRPLVIYDDIKHTQYTDDTAYIYDHGYFPAERF